MMDTITVESQWIKDQLLERFDHKNKRRYYNGYNKGRDYQINIPCILCELYRTNTMHFCTQRCPLQQYATSKKLGCYYYLEQETGMDHNEIDLWMDTTQLLWNAFLANAETIRYLNKVRALISNWQVEGE